jgi:hypothetical protein
MSEDGIKAEILEVLIEEYKDISRVRTHDDTLALSITTITFTAVTTFFLASIQFKGSGFVLIPASFAMLIFWYFFYNKLEKHSKTRIGRLEQIEKELVQISGLNKSDGEAYLMHYGLIKKEAGFYSIHDLRIVLLLIFITLGVIIFLWNIQQMIMMYSHHYYLPYQMHCR